MAITVTESLIPSTVNTPLDKRSRVATLADVAAMENPVLGGIFYCNADGKHYRITALKSKTIGGLTVANAAVDTYEQIPDQDDIGGCLKRSIISSSTTASTGEWYLCESDITITLPAVTSGGIVKVSTIGSASSVTINPAESNTIAGDSAFLLDNTHNSVELIGNSGGTMWIVAEVVAN